MNSQHNIGDIIKTLHPTPAVCGLPRNLAKDFILQNEDYHRSYYTGFLGELNFKNQQSSLFVNLRCMEISGETASIYVGGGITKESIPETRHDAYADQKFPVWKPKLSSYQALPPKPHNT